MRNLSKLFIKLYLLMAVLGAWTNSYAQIIEVESITCPGLSNGQLTVHTTFGTPPYTYLWNTGSTNDKIQGLPAGNYSVTVTDALLATENWNYNLKDPTPISNVIVKTANSTWPANNGTFTVTTTGGSGLVTYSVVDSIARTTTNQASPNFTGLASGTYFLTTTDVNGCFVNNTIRIVEWADYLDCHTLDTTACYFDTAPSSVKPDTLPSSRYPMQIYFDDMVTPYETILGYRRGATMFNGTVSVPMLGLGVLPTDPHFILASQVMVVPSGPNAGKDSSIVEYASISNGFEPGFHVLKLVTANNKGYRYSWNVDSVTAPIAINISSIVHNTCYGDASGSFTCTAEGSYEGFTYSITGPVGFTPLTTASANNLSAGVYTFTATDWTISCSRTEKISIEQPDEPLRIVWDPAKNARCPYSMDGAANFRRIDGAVGTPTFLWSNGETTPNLTNIKPGTYILTVTDANGCTGQDSVRIEGDRKNCFYNIITPNGDGYNDKFDLTDFCVGVQMKAVIFNEAGKQVATLDETNPTWDAYNASLPPTGTSSTYTCFVSLFEDGVKTVEFSESFSVIYPK